MGITTNIIENDFQRNQSSAYQLSILAGLDSLVYAIHDDASQKLLVLKHLQVPIAEGETAIASCAALEEAIGKDELLGLLYRRVRVAFSGAIASLVPERLFSDYEKDTYLQELTTASKQAEVKADDLVALKAKAVYQLDQAYSKMLKTRFPTAHFFSLTTPFLLGSLQMVPDDVAATAFACFQENTFQLAIFDKKNLLFYNDFSYRSANDVLYFLLLALEQHNLDAAEVPVFLSGKIVPDSDINKLLFRYIGQISFLPKPTFVKFGKAAAATDPNLLFPLHSLLLCK